MFTVGRTQPYKGPFAVDDTVVNNVRTLTNLCIAMCRNICCTRKVRHMTIISRYLNVFRGILTSTHTNVYFRPLLNNWRLLFSQEPHWHIVLLCGWREQRRKDSWRRLAAVEENASRNSTYSSHTSVRSSTMCQASTSAAVRCVSRRLFAAATVRSGTTSDVSTQSTSSRRPRTYVIAESIIYLFSVQIVHVGVHERNKKRHTLYCGMQITWPFLFGLVLIITHFYDSPVWAPGPAVRIGPTPLPDRRS